MGRRVKGEQHFYGNGSNMDYQWQYWDYYHLEDERRNTRFTAPGKVLANIQKQQRDPAGGGGSHYLYHVKNQKKKKRGLGLPGGSRPLQEQPSGEDIPYVTGYALTDVPIIKPLQG